MNLKFRQRRGFRKYFSYTKGLSKVVQQFCFPLTWEPFSIFTQFFLWLPFNPRTGFPPDPVVRVRSLLKLFFLQSGYFFNLSIKSWWMGSLWGCKKVILASLELSLGYPLQGLSFVRKRHKKVNFVMTLGLVALLYRPFKFSQNLSSELVNYI